MCAAFNSLPFSFSFFNFSSIDLEFLSYTKNSDSGFQKLISAKNFTENMMSGARNSQCNSSNNGSSISETSISSQEPPPPQPTLSRYESQKRRDWNTFGQYLKNHKPPLVLSRCSGAHILEFLRYLDQFGKTKVHNNTCPFYGHPHPPASCPCPLKQAWGSLDALIGRLRAAFEENGGLSEANPFGARAVRLYLREVRDAQAKARGIAYEKKKRKKPQQKQETQVMFEELDCNGVNSAVVSNENLVMGGSSESRNSMIPLSVLN